MAVKELIKFLQKQPQGLQVAFECYSEHCLLEFDDIKILDLCVPRDDGWVHDKRPDKKSQTYLIFPGN